MKIIDTSTKKTVAEIITNRSMSIDDIISLMQWTVDGDGRIFDCGEYIADYDNIDMVYGG